MIWLYERDEFCWKAEPSDRHEAICAEAPPEKIRLPANLARHADFAVVVRGDSIEPMVSEGLRLLNMSEMGE